MDKDYKDTLNLPNTDFPMKANLTNKEPQILSFWKEHAIYEKMVSSKDRQNTYILHDGPPYANGNIHIGHALNKILKDIIVKYNTMKGFYSPYIPGWDCHGLPIEHQVDKNLGKKKYEIGILEKRNLCREYALKYLDIQRDEFIRLGVSGQWDKPYLTIDYEYEATILREFYNFLENGSVYQGKKPVHWCPSCVTALAEAEVEYMEKQSPSVFVRFKVCDDDTNKLLENAKKPLYILIWTTTPWTLPANLALAVHTDVQYAIVEADDHYIIAAEALLEKLAQTIAINCTAVKKTLTGANLSGIKAHHPFIDRLSEVVTAAFVTVEDGTGVVHIAPGHGEDDFQVGLKHGLDIYVPVDDNGIFTKEAGEFAGQFVFKANVPIIETLKENGALLKRTDITHSYPHCWRCKNPVIFRATKQWFISMSSNSLRQRCLEEIEKVNWIPSWGKDRIYAMIKNRPDWCLSRQRSWGVPIAVFKCRNCGEIVLDKDINGAVVAAFKEKGADVWFTEEANRRFLPDGYKCKKCASSAFVRETDILDVWFDSGVSHSAVLEKRDTLRWPADMYLEGSDQHRGWFQSSLIASTGTRLRSPFNTVLTHGFVVDGKGKKMSKSTGNVISPQEIIKANGADILRLWCSAEDYRNDIRISKEIVQRLTEAYRKIRNTCRFLLGNISDFDANNYNGALLEIDKYAISRLQRLIDNVSRSYDNYQFHEVFHSIYNFCVVDMSSFYLDILKDRVYTFNKTCSERQAAQYTMREILTAITRLMAPILSFTAEEIWQSLRKTPNLTTKTESVLLADFPVADAALMDDTLEQKWSDLIIIRDVVNKALELRRQERLIGNSLEAKVTVFAKGKYYDLLNSYADFLPTLFIVSASEIAQYDETVVKGDGSLYVSDEPSDVAVLVSLAQGKKCQRCWNVSPSVGTFSEDADICGRCHKAIFS
ncbi:Isoleucyl-tRNA synthetase [Candidatus Magnetoovum chiemensis]|nr:Isoleucyl-tRNA synthetase [Candidatus Magnetoovum chiemensis]